MHQESMAKLMSHSTWHSKTIESVTRDIIPEPRRTFGKHLNIYEVQQNGKTLEYTPMISAMEDCLRNCGPGARVYRIHPSGIKHLIKVKK